MAPIRFKVDNAVATAKEIEELGQKVVAAINPVIRRGALRLASRIVKLVQQGSRSGRDYPRPGGTVHKASAPGEPPKSDSGFLASHVNPSATRESGGVISATVVLSSIYSGFLEDGTENMEARPFVAPSFALEAPEIDRDAARAIRGALS